MFDLQDVTIRHDGAEDDSLRGVTLRLRPGATTAVLGLSGSGKSTLLNLLGLLWDGGPSSGTVHYLGEPPGDGSPAIRHDYATLPPRARAALRLRDFGFVLQSSYLLKHFSCAQNVAMPLELQGVDRPTQAERVGALLAESGMARLGGRVARKLSGGEGQRIAVLRAIVHDPRVVFADEPFSSLDRHHAGLVLKLLREWREGNLSGRGSRRDGRTLVLVSHSIEVALEHADDFILLHGGRLVGGRVYQRGHFRGPEAILRAIEEGVAPLAPGSNGRDDHEAPHLPSLGEVPA